MGRQSVCCFAGVDWLPFLTSALIFERRTMAGLYVIYCFPEVIREAAVSEYFPETSPVSPCCTEIVVYQKRALP